MKNCVPDFWDGLSVDQESDTALELENVVGFLENIGILCKAKLSSKTSSR